VLPPCAKVSKRRYRISLRVDLLAASFLSLRFDLLAVSFGERVTEEPLVFRKDLRVPPIAEALEEHGGPLDVGEEEGDRPGRQVGQMRPP
jgi:hypothetical protein